MAPPRKRARPEGSTPESAQPQLGSPKEPDDQLQNERITVPLTMTEQVPSSEAEKEARAGITAYARPDMRGFQGVVKHRYTDFLVNEISPSGLVWRLENVLGVKPKSKRDPTTDAPSMDTSSAGRAQGEGTTENAVSKPMAQATPDTNALTVSPDEQVAAPTAKDIDFKLAPADRARLESLFGKETATAIKDLYHDVLKYPNRKAKFHATIFLDPIDDKDERTDAHKIIRQLFGSRLETITGSDNSIKIGAALPGQQKGDSQPRGRIGWEELGGDFLHFTLYKENKDTMEALSFLGSKLKTGQKRFEVAGTKDRRAVTTQRISIFRQTKESLAKIAPQLNNAYIGDATYRPRGLQLGELAGNEFTITIRDCHFPGEEGMTIDQRMQLADDVVKPAACSLETEGFINYFGLQRFGTFAYSTDSIGIKILQGDLRGAIEKILSISPTAMAAARAYDANDEVRPKDFPLVSYDDRQRALAIYTWHRDGNSKKALQILPRKFGAEAAIINHLGYRKGNADPNDPSSFPTRKDYQGALVHIPRHTRTIYMHAYQSLVWNVAAAERWNRLGPKVIEGDLVLVREARLKVKDEDGDTKMEDEVDESGEPIVRPAEGDRAISGGRPGGKGKGKESDDNFERARHVTAEEAARGVFNIYDVVLPLPGWDVLYPNNEIGEFYREFMGSDRGGGLDPYNMRRKWKDASLMGNYRKVFARAKNVEYELRAYGNGPRGDEEQFVPTDVDRLGIERDAKFGFAGDGKATESEGGPTKVAVILKLQLGVSQYATMAMREIMKGGGVPYQPEYAGR
ncbi:putative pseudouridine synthase TruD/Pus7 [Lineolata rhizophorae]|uniref:Putative pseudouridine synthase TruD/Pus7 n=1 Tax=Lineolata rhizophorae TaxID=578093 RepID=A0A6A6PD23_9PEZI|nr:putative pseudouridine synthase TruD/Pus7 [Lineolata rhizophorae]